jgi:hypothetical protein
MAQGAGQKLAVVRVLGLGFEFPKQPDPLSPFS